VDRLTRKELRTDQVAETAASVFEWSSHHTAMLKRYGAILVAVVVIGLGVFFYNRSQSTARQEALAHAMQVAEATTGTQTQEYVLHYGSEQEKEKAMTEAFNSVATKYSGSDEGSVADMLLGAAAADKGDLAEAERRYKQVADNGPKDYAAMARLSLAQVYQAQNKIGDAEKLLRQAIDNPTSTVSKEQATLALGSLLTTTNPAEARKLLEPLRASKRSPVARAAITAVGKLPPAK
jgi:predicted negative regulator of RcsB-dependent stress response